jgi:hypothetical protein
MTTLTITSANNKKYISKTISLNKETGIATLGRTEYTIDFGIHQPNKHLGSYKVVDHTVETATRFVLYKVGSSNSNTGIVIHSFTK